MSLPKHIRVLSAASRTILLCGPSEPYLQSLSKALAYHFNARLLLLDVPQFSRRIEHKYGSASSSLVRKRSLTEAALDKVSGLVGSFNFFRKKDEPTESLNHGKNILDLRTGNCCASYTPSVRVHVSLLPGALGHDSDSLEEFESVTESWNLDEKILIQSLYKIIISVSECNPVILYIRDVNILLGISDRAHSMFQKMLSKLSGQVLIIGSQFLESDEDSYDVDEDVSALFPYILETKPPKEETHLAQWKTQMEEDTKKTEGQKAKNIIADVLSANSLECDDLNSFDPDDNLTAVGSYIGEIMAPAVSYHLMNNKDPEYRNGKLIISSESLSHGLSIFQESNLGKDTVEPKDDTKKSAPDNEFEKLIRPTVIPANQIGVTFDDIGALADIKESLQELVMLPLQRPELFNGGGLLKPCRGILLFGPPGTGKTMLAKAIANEAGASFLNISMSTILSKWFGEAEKITRALFSLAAKIAPAIVFVDEVDSMLGQRDNPNEHELPRRVKNEFMTHWDGLLSKSTERILVLAATNRPFDLDEAIIRRFEHRIMVGLPTLDSRELILKKLLSKEKVESIDFKELATLTEGYSGSDLKNLCVTAAYRPVRELIQEEQKKKGDKKGNALEVKGEPGANPKNQESVENSESKQGEKGMQGQTGETVALRSLTMDDLRNAKDQVGASLASEGAVMNAIKQWNELYGKGGSRKKEQLTYFL
ncbi:hypothetical protein BRADI_2g43980v3 [Brachypodium distachyon]|nr:hypothetical protein BRADI_2g43980v3 [Brachypodium distachyon]